MQHLIDLLIANGCVASVVAAWAWKNLGGRQG